MQPSVHNAVNPFTEGGASGSTDPAPAEEDQLVEFTNTELLKQQACSIEHLATHATFNQYCQTCREAKASRAHKRNKKKQREKAREKTGEVDPSDGRSTLRFGDQVTGDYLLQRRNEVKNEAFNTDHPGSKAAIVLWDMGTDCLFIAPTATRSEQETRKAMTDFIGPTDDVRSFYSDNAPELKKAARSLEICHPTSTPACADTNGLAEGKVKLGKAGTRGQLIHSGFHKTWWPKAAVVYADNHTFTPSVRWPTDPKESPYERRLKVKFKGTMFALGQLVDFMTTPFPCNTPAPFAERMIPGLFVGYHTQPGGKFNGDYYVIEYSALQANPDMPWNLARKHMHRVKEVKPAITESGRPRFPLGERRMLSSVSRRPYRWLVRTVCRT